MSHYPGHKRDAFERWVEAGMPDEAEMEFNYELESWSAEEFLREFLGCTDVVPKPLRHEIQFQTDLDEQRVMTYAWAAHELLVLRRTAVS